MADVQLDAKPQHLDDIDRRALLDANEAVRLAGVEQARYQVAVGLVRAKLAIPPETDLPTEVGAQYRLDTELERVGALSTATGAALTALSEALKEKYNLADGDTYDLKTGVIARNP